MNGQLVSKYETTEGIEAFEMLNGRNKKNEKDDQSKLSECPHVSSQMERRNEEKLKSLMSKSTSYFVAPPGFVHLRRAFPLRKGGDIEIIMILSSQIRPQKNLTRSGILPTVLNTLSQNKESSKLYQALLGNEAVAYKMSPITSTAQITNAEDILTFPPSNCLSISNFISGFQTSFCAPDVVLLPVLLVPTPVSPQSKASRQSEALGRSASYTRFFHVLLITSNRFFLTVSKSICFKTSSDMAKTVIYPLANSPAFNITEIQFTPLFCDGEYEEEVGISEFIPCCLHRLWVSRARHHHGIGCDRTRFDLNREHPIRTLANMETFTADSKMFKSEVVLA
ncbi:hypothetical protein EGR_07556 [Echinococcus granulosus]|uniref:Uncharacterized protein n=1 Tax=Echinococcus granulosus TaxID=6210 RepID=W6UVX6_ECHGR|nr:hypothetical protein EGR_07556 [Echinococcus granulosus]EUB57614.1 hypothetical protein EGR_07556 [Echinococcus granulosus]